MWKNPLQPVAGSIADFEGLIGEVYGRRTDSW
jgi:hypothetical protein